MGPADVALAGGSLTCGEMVAPRGLVQMAAYADVVAPVSRAIISLGTDERLARPATLVADAHRAGL